MCEVFLLLLFLDIKRCFFFFLLLLLLLFLFYFFFKRSHILEVSGCFFSTFEFIFLKPTTRTNRLFCFNPFWIPMLSQTGHPLEPRGIQDEGSLVVDVGQPEGTVFRLRSKEKT